MEKDKQPESGYNQENVASRKYRKKHPDVLALEKYLKTGSRLAKKIDEMDSKFFNGQADGTRLTKMFADKKKQHDATKQKEAKKDSTKKYSKTPKEKKKPKEISKRKGGFVIIETKSLNNQVRKNIIILHWC